MDWIDFILPSAAVGLVCLWGALCILCIGGWLVHRQKRPPLSEQQERSIQEIPGITWRDPAYWIFAFFCWPVLVALILDYRWQRGKR